MDLETINTVSVKERSSFKKTICITDNVTQKWITVSFEEAEFIVNSILEILTKPVGSK